MMVAMTYSDDYNNCGISDDGGDDFVDGDDDRHDLSESNNGDDDYGDGNDGRNEFSLHR